MEPGRQPTYVMVNTTWSGRAADDPPTLDEVAVRYGIPEDAFDRSFGVIGVAPDQGIFTVLVEERWASRIGDAAFPTGHIETAGR